MARLPETPAFTPDIYLIETTDKVLGGQDGVVNLQSKQLADRTVYLKQKVEAAAGVAEEAKTNADSALDQISSAEAAMGNAAASAAAANQYKQDALAAKALAEQARGGAQDSAAAAAESAQYSASDRVLAGQRASEASAAAAAAVNASSFVVAAKNAADAARDAAISARNDAQGFAEMADQDRIAAETARTGAEESATASSLSAGNANDARVAAEAARDAVYGDLGSTTNSAKGSGLLGFGEGLAYPAGSAGKAIQSRLPEIATYAALRAYNGPVTSYLVRGLSDNFDGAAGVFRVDAADTTTADNGGTVLVDASNRRWKRVFDGVLRPEYWGAFGGITFGYDPTTANGTPTGAESTAAFKAMMAVAQAMGRASIELRPGAYYYVTGDNPCGMQNNVASSCVINIEGNNSRIYWKPTLATDSCFGKLGLLYMPQWQNFRVVTLGAPGSRNGIVFNTKLGFSNLHYFSLAAFRNIGVNLGSSIGCDKVFNFEADGTNSHDDLSVFEHISAVCYNVFSNQLNSESVANVWRKCVTFSYTTGAVTFNVNASGAAFSGYLDIDQHHFTVFNNETLIKTKDESILYPIYLRSPRMEKRADVPYKLFDLGSCRLIVSGLSSALGGNSTYFYSSNQYIRIGQYAGLVLEDCRVLDGNIQIDATTGSPSGQALVANRCSFRRSYGGAASVYPFPKITWGTYASRAAALAAGAKFCSVAINDPDNVSSFAIPMSFGRRYVHDTKGIVISNMMTTGKSSLSGVLAVPEDILFESLYLRVEAFTTTSVDALDVAVTSPTGSFVKTYTVSFTGVAVSTELVTSGKVLTLPQDAAITFTWKKAGVAVSDSTLFPEARIEARYREIISTREGNSGTRGEINII